MLVICKQVLPVINGSSIKLGPMFRIHCFHHTKLCKLWQLFGAMSLVGDKATAAYGGQYWLAKRLGTPTAEENLLPNDPYLLTCMA